MSPAREAFNVRRSYQAAHRWTGWRGLAPAPPAAPVSRRRKRTVVQPMTKPQIVLLERLCKEAEVSFDSTLSKQSASRRIEALRRQLGH